MIFLESSMTKSLGEKNMKYFSLLRMKSLGVFFVCFFFLLCSVESMQQSLEMKSKDSHGVLFLEGTQVITNKKGFVMGSNASLGVNKAKSGGSF